MYVIVPCWLFSKPDIIVVGKISSVDSEGYLCRFTFGMLLLFIKLVSCPSKGSEVVCGMLGVALNWSMHLGQIKHLTFSLHMHVNMSLVKGLEVSLIHPVVLCVYIHPGYCDTWPTDYPTLDPSGCH